MPNKQVTLGLLLFLMITTGYSVLLSKCSGTEEEGPGAVAEKEKQ